MRYAQVAWRVFLSVFFARRLAMPRLEQVMKARRSFSALVAVSLVNETQSLTEKRDEEVDYDLDGC